MLLLLAAAALAASPAEAYRFSWPDATTHPRVILDADQGIKDQMNEHPEWFEKDFLIAGFYMKQVPYDQADMAARFYGGLRDAFFRRNMTVGTYISGTTVLHEFSLTSYPANAVSIENISVKTKYLGPWLREPSHLAVDLRDANSRHQLQGGIRALWAHAPTLMRFIDDAAVHPSVARLQRWEDYCTNMHELRDMAGAWNANVIFNVFVRPWEMSDAETKQLIAGVGAGNGISLPLPWSKSIKDDTKATTMAIYRYRQLLDQGIAIIVIPSDDAPQTELITWLASWRKPTDRLYIAIPYWQETPW